MDDSLMDSVFGDEVASDFSLPAVLQKTKAKPAVKAVKSRVAAPKSRGPARKKMVQTKLSPKAKPEPPKQSLGRSVEGDESGPEQDSFHDDSLLSATPPAREKQRKAPIPKKNGGKPLASVRNEAVTFDGADESKPKRGGSTEQYQKLTQLEHIIKRPDTYIGSVERSEKHMWVYNSIEESMEMREVSYVPGLYKIFDEILVNAADNKVRDKNMDTIKVVMDREKGEISVWNNGRGIPIEIHEKENIYIPEMIFGHLLTSSNYDDEQEKVTGGRNGYGAKLCNVFSTVFTLETADARSKKRYKQTWTSNMTKMGKAVITSNNGDDFTKVTFTPDFSKFGMTGIDDDFEALVKRRVYDIAGTIRGLKVYLNGSMIKLKDFKKYMEMYTKAIKLERGEEAKSDASEIVAESPNSRWEIGFAVSDGTFQQVSFVNSIATTSGGSHVNYIADQVCSKLMDIVKKRNKGGATLKPTQIKNHIFLFVNCQIVNPAFTSQTKEQLTTKSTQFGSKCIVSDEFLKKIAKTDVITNILSFAQQKADQILKKSDGNRRSRMDNPKLTDANKAGTKDGYQCTLILTEGDSAKGLAMAGRSIVGPDLFGVFPLRGKLLNVRDASVDQVSKNAEIQNIKNILGLKHKTNYLDCKSLRYGHIMIMTDQDHDGSHIKGLLINFLQVSYPSLLRIPEFLIEFITPIVKVFKGDPKQPTKSRSFFTMPEYDAWKVEHRHERGWEHKYYKGLGTSTTEDAQVYFRDLDKHLKDFHVMQENEAELIELAFSKKKADERKEWLRQFKPGTYLDHSIKRITYTDFVNKELILFSMADNLRSIPSVVDGLKPGQRKVLYACFKKNLKKDMKVVELAGYVSGLTAYQHGDTSLQQTIVGLAQTFVGSNNVNCLEPSGNFGSRLQGGSDSASARYIYTRLSPFVRRVFHPLDEPILKYNTDDNRTIEPEVYVPVVPMILVNGADGIGTGWSSSIPNYNPEDIVKNLRLMMNGQEPEEMVPWFRDFKGKVTMMGPDRYKFSGIITQTGDSEVEITELPIRMWTQDFKDKLVDIIKAEKVPSWIRDYDDYNTHKSVHFVVRLEEKHMKIALEEGLEEKFKLSKSIATSNLVAFDAEGRITKYATVEDILREFYQLRLKFYTKRKEWQLSEWGKELEKLTNQARFIQMIINGKLVVAKKKKKDLVVELSMLNFKPFPKSVDPSKEGEAEPFMEDEDIDEAHVENEASAYDYLLGMPIWSLTKERVDKLLKQIGDKELEIDSLIKLSKEHLWSMDLDEFIKEWRFQLEDEAKRQRKAASQGRRISSKLKTQVKSLSRKRKNDDSFSDSDFSSKKTKRSAVVKGTQAKAVASKMAKQSALSTLTSVASLPEQNLTVDTDSDADKGPKLSLDGAAGHGPDHLIAPTPTERKNLASTKRSVLSNAVAIVRAQTDGEDDDDKSHIRPATTAVSRASRAAARKPIHYTTLSDSELDDEDDMVLDVGKMVKGIGSFVGDVPTGSRSLFSTTTTQSRRPGSTVLAARKTKAPPSVDLGDSHDETDYTRLAPASNGGSKAVARSTILSDDSAEDGSSILVVPVNVRSLPKPSTKTAGRVLAAKNKSVVPEKAKTLVPLSPAAKAYATKQHARSNKASVHATSAKSRTKGKSMASDSEDDVVKVANEMLSDDEDDQVVAVPRPARRAAASQPKKWVIDDEDDDEEEDVSRFVENESD